MSNLLRAAEAARLVARQCEGLDIVAITAFKVGALTVTPDNRWDGITLAARLGHTDPPKPHSTDDRGHAWEALTPTVAGIDVLILFRAEDPGEM